MAKEPDSLVLRLLRDIRATQGMHGADLTHLKMDLTHLKGRVEDLYKISTHTLGVAANAQRAIRGARGSRSRTSRARRSLGRETLKQQGS
jgi:hypothetical protein